MSSVHLVVPEGIDDVEQPSGGNTYDRRIRDGLSDLGWTVHEHAVVGGGRGLSAALTSVPDGAAVLVDGLVASTAPEVIVPEGRRVRDVVLLHMPVGDARERTVLTSAAAVVTTSGWTRRWLMDRYALPSALVHVAEPGVDTADLAVSSEAGEELICVAAVTPGKGHDVLLASLATLAHRSWRLTCVGSLTRDAGFVDRLRSQAREAGLEDRIRFTGPLAGDELAAAYATSDLLVLASRTETYGMVVTEALARGLPVLATTVGGLPEAVGRGAGGNRPGLMVPPGDPALLALALSRWLDDAELRGRLRETARERRAQLRGWDVTSGRISEVLGEVVR